MRNILVVTGGAGFIGSNLISELLKLKTFLNETDRRRRTNWAEVFPWLVKELEHVV